MVIMVINFNRYGQIVITDITYYARITTNTYTTTSLADIKSHQIKHRRIIIPPQWRAHMMPDRAVPKINRAQNKPNLFYITKAFNGRTRLFPPRRKQDWNYQHILIISISLEAMISPIFRLCDSSLLYRYMICYTVNHMFLVNRIRDCQANDINLC